MTKIFNVAIYLLISTDLMNVYRVYSYKFSRDVNFAVFADNASMVHEN